MSDSTEKNALLQLRVPEGLLAATKRLAKQKSIPTSDYVRGAVTNQLALDTLSEKAYELSIDIGEPYGRGRWDKDEYEICATIKFPNMSFPSSDKAGFYVLNPIYFSLPEFIEDNREPYRIDSFFFCRVVFPGAYNNKGRLLGAKFNLAEDGSLALEWKGAVFLYKDIYLKQPKIAFDAIKGALEESIRSSIDNYINSFNALLGVESTATNDGTMGLFFRNKNSLLSVKRGLGDDYGAWQFELVLLNDSIRISNSMLTQIAIPRIKNRYIHFDAKYTDAKAIGDGEYEIAFKFLDGIAKGYIYTSGISEEDNPTGILEVSAEFEQILSAKVASLLQFNE